MASTYGRGIILLSILLATAVSVAEASHLPPNRIEMTLVEDPSGDLVLSWVDLCAGAATDYAVYEGTLTGYPDHDSLLCTTGGALTATVSPTTDDTYYLVVPLDDGAEGSYGVDGDGIERPVSSNACLPQQTVLSCDLPSFVDASAADLARMDEVMAAAEVVIAADGTFTDVANLLNTFPDVDHIFSDTVSLYFSVRGYPMVIIDAVAASREGPPNEVIPPPAALVARAKARERALGGSGAHASEPVTMPSDGPDSALAAGLLPANQVQGMLPRGQRMVGLDDDSDGFRDMPKHALILAPYAFYFAALDPTVTMKTILDGVHDYQQGSVDRRFNDTDLLQDTMELTDYFVDWDKKDIIVLATHGKSNPVAEWGPGPYLALGIGGVSYGVIAAKLAADVPDPAMRPGLVPSAVRRIGPDSVPFIGYDTVATAAFWEHHHKGKLDKKLIYILSCESAANPGLAEALTGPDSIFFGWSHPVAAPKANDASSRLLRETVEDDFPVLRSFVHECADGSCQETTAGWPPADLLAAWNRADLRTVDSLGLQGPPLTGFCGVSPTQPVEQTCPSCGGGVAMGIQYGITLAGVEADELVLIRDPVEFGLYQLRLFADVDGVESGYAFALIDPFMIPLGNGQYSLPGVSLFMDDICPYQELEYNPWVLLPAFDPNQGANEQRDRIYSWDGPFMIYIDPTILP